MKKLVLAFILFSIQSYAADLSSWCGTHKGDLQATQLNGASTVYKMALLIEAIDETSWKWHITYGEGYNQQLRAYTLQATDQKDKFLLDENNGIILEFYLINNIMFSVYQLGDNLMQVEYELKSNGIEFRLTSSTTGTSTGKGTKEIPTVQNFSVGTRQFAMLERD